MFNFTVKEFLIGSGTGTPTLQFYKKGFEIGGGGGTPSWQDVILSGNTALTLVNSKANGLNYLKLFGGTEQRNIPAEYTQVNYVTNTAKTWLDTGVKFDFSKNYEIEIRARGTSGSWYILQARDGGSAPIYGITGSSTNNTIILSFLGTTIGSQITRTTGNIYYVKGTINNGNLTLYVKDETAGTEGTVTGTYTLTTGQSVNIGLLGNGAIAGGSLQAVEINSNVYFARIKEDGNYILNYVPCSQNATAGFYDKASGTFKTTTDLSAGANVTTPSPDTPMDIVSNNGVLKASPNLVKFNETRINSSTWDSADKTKGVEVYADVYSKSVGDSMLTNANAFGVFVPCKQGESISLNFFDYEPFSTRCLYCEITADRKCNTTPQTYENAGVITQKTFTLTKNDSIGFIFEWWINSQQTRNYTASNYMIVKGSTPPTKYIPYGTVYTDGTVETVEVTGKNIFDKNTMNTQRGWYVSDASTLTIGDVANSNRTIVIDCKPNTKYSYWHTEGSGGGRAFDMSEDTIEANDIANKWLGAPLIAEKNQVTTYTTSSTAKKLYILAGRKDNIISRPFEEQLADFMVVEGEVTTATTYEPYFNGGSATAEMLLSVGDYKDEQSVIDGSVTRKVGIKVLDGTEDWINQPSYSRYTVVISNLDSNGTNLYCTHLKNSSATQGNCRILSGQRICFYVMESYTTVDAWKQWLADQYNAGTPVIIVYPLETPTTETVTGQPLSVQAGTNIVEITQASIDNLPIEVSYKAGVAVTITEVQNAQLDNSVEVTING